MNIDNFKQTFVNYCRNEIKELYKECEIEGRFQVSLFNSNLSTAWLSAQMNGLDEHEFSSVVEDVVTVDIYNILFPFEVEYAQAA